MLIASLIVLYIFFPSRRPVACICYPVSPSFAQACGAGLFSAGVSRLQDAPYAGYRLPAAPYALIPTGLIYPARPVRVSCSVALCGACVLWCDCIVSLLSEYVNTFYHFSVIYF